MCMLHVRDAGATSWSALHSQDGATMPTFARGAPVPRMRRLSRALLAASALLLTFAVTTAASAVPVHSRRASLVPVVVIVMENKPYQRLIGNADAPFINGTMIPGGLLDTNYFAVPGSQPDYLLMVSGRTKPPPTAQNLFASLGRRTSWREFMESMPRRCYGAISSHVVFGTTAALYARAHNPAIHFTNITKTSLCDNVVPLDRKNFTPKALPRLSFVVPNECNDMHTQPTNDQCPMWNGRTNTGASEMTLGDNWLASFVPAVARVATVILTWDEGEESDEQVATLTYGLGVAPGQDGTPYRQSSLEAGLYRYFGLGAAPGRGTSVRALPIP